MAEKIEGLSIGLDLNTIEVEQGYRKLQRDMKTMNSEMKKNMSAFDRADDSLEKHEKSLEGVRKKLELQEKTTEAARREMVKMTDQHGASSAKAQKATRDYNEQVAALRNLERYTENATEKVEKMRKEQDQANSLFGKASSKMEAFSDRASGAADKMEDLSGKLQGVSTVLGGLGGGALIVAGKFDDSTARIQNSLGLTAEEAEALTEKSRNIYEKGFGQSMEEVDKALLQTKQNIRDLDDEDLEDITQKALVLSETFEADVNEVTRAGNNLMEGFGLESDKAFDLMARGAQNGLNFSNEMFDNLSEYSSLFADMGFSAEEYFQILQTGADNGVYNLDYLNDVMKEFGVRVQDGSDKTAEAMGQLSEGTQNVFKEFRNGEATASDVFDNVTSDLSKMDDRTANMIGVELFGTKWEDLGGDAVKALGEIDGEIKNVDGAMDKMSKTAEESFSQRAQSTWREFQEALLPVGEIILDVAEDALPKISSAVEDATEWFEELSPEMQKTVVAAGAIGAALAPLSLIFSGVFRGVAVASRGLGKLTGGMSKIGKSAKSSKKNLSNLGATAATTGGKVTKNAGKFGKVAGKISKVGKVAGVARLGLGALGGPMGILATIAIPKLIEGGVKLANHLRKDSMPAVDGFGKKVDDTTTEAVLGYKKLNDEATVELNELFWSGQKITQKGSEKITGLFNQMGNQIRTSMDEKFKQSKSSISQLMADTTAISQKGEDQILQNMQESHNKQKQGVKQKENRIKEIMNTASQEKRSLTKSEKNEINKLQRQMRNTAVKTMSDSEVEQVAIMDRLRQKSGKISARQAAKTVKESKKAKDGAVSDAKEKYDKVVQSIIRERDETGSISADEADKLIEAAKEQKNESISAAVKKHKNVVREAKKQAKGQIDNVNWTTGEVLSNWDKMVRGTMKATNWVLRGINWVLDKIGIKEIPLFDLSGYSGVAGNGHQGPGGPAKRYAEGTGKTAHRGGPAIVGEEGPELAFVPGKGTTILGSQGPEFHKNFPKGSAVLPNKETEETLKSFGFPGYANGVGDFFQSAFNAPKKMIQSAWNRFKPDLPNLGGGFGSMFNGIVGSLKDYASDYLKDKIKGFFSSGSGKGSMNAGLTKTSSYGMRLHPIRKTWRLHAGDDYGGPMGTPIPAQTGGRVSYAGWGGGYGNLVKVASGIYEHLYAHLNSIAVSTGQAIKRGSIIGGLGTTGDSTGPHLHYEVRKNGTPIRPTASYATGGLVQQRGLYELAEEGYPEWVIPTDPKRRTEAMKLLALAGKDISKSRSKNKRPDNFPGNVSTQANDRTNEIIDKLSQQVELLTQLVLKDSNVYLDSRELGRGTYRVITEFQERDRRDGM